MVIDNICKYCGARNMEKQIADTCGSNMCEIHAMIDSNYFRCAFCNNYFTDEDREIHMTCLEKYLYAKEQKVQPTRDYCDEHMDYAEFCRGKHRKDTPVFSGVMQYFPDALMEIAKHSKRGNDKHNPGQPLHWAKDKSSDQADCVARHLIDIGSSWDALDVETGSLHATALAWRALALLQTVLERKKK